MKKMFKVLVAMIVTMGLLVACGGSGKGGAVKLGIGSVQNVKEIEDRATGLPGVEFNTVVVGVALQDDKVAYVKIDESQQKALLENDLFTGEAIKTKGQRKEDYNMKPASPIGKEWYEQIQAVEADLIGKTKEEVKTYFEGEEVKSSSTMDNDDYAAAVLKAIDNATVEASGVAKVGFGYEVGVNIKGDGLKPESVVDFALLAVDADGKIVKALLDNSQEKAEFKDGKIVSHNIGKTKGELKEAYDMKKASPIGKEWNEQNDALMDHLVGMTVSDFGAYDVEASKVDDLKSTVTIVIAGPQAALKNAESALVELK